MGLKKKWEKPKLVLFVKFKKPEAVLEGCKYLFASGAGPDWGDSGCNLENCSPCSNLAPGT